MELYCIILTFQQKINKILDKSEQISSVLLNSDW